MSQHFAEYESVIVIDTVPLERDLFTRMVSICLILVSLNYVVSFYPTCLRNLLLISDVGQGQLAELMFHPGLMM